MHDYNDDGFGGSSRTSNAFEQAKRDEYKPNYLSENEYNKNALSTQDIIARLTEENKRLKETLYPHKGANGTYPLILYSKSRQEADEFVALVQEANPGMKNYKI